MKKGIIVEHKSRYTIVMDKDGVFHKAIPMKEKDIGMETLYQQKQSIWQSFFLFFRGPIKWQLVPMVLICLLLISPLYIWVADEKAYAVVSIDINPSMNITIDENYHVLDVEPMNEDAEQLMDNLEVKNRTITSLTDEILNTITMDTEDPEADRPVLMAVSYIDEEKQDHHFEDELGSYYQHLGYQVAIYEVSEELRTQSELEHVSMNELTAQSLEVSGGSDVKQVATESDTPKTSLNTEERELIENFYNHNKQEEEAIQEEIEIDETEHEENEEDIEETNQGESKKETNDPVILPANASERAKEQISTNNGKKKDNNGQKVIEKNKAKKNENGKGQKSKSKSKGKKQNQNKQHDKGKTDKKSKGKQDNKSNKSNKSKFNHNNKSHKKDKSQKKHPGKGHNK